MKLSIRQKLLGALGLDLVLLLALGVFAWTGLGRVKKEASWVAARSLPILETVDRIERVHSHYRSVQLEFFIVANRADKDRLELAMGELEAEMDDLLQEARVALAGGEDRRTFDRVENAWKRYVEASHSRFLPAARQGNTGTVQPAISRLNPLYANLEAAALELTVASEERANASLAVVLDTARRGRLFVLAVTITALALAAAIGLWLATTMARRIRRLTSATIAVAGGDLERQVEAAGGDELETLAHNFNEMVARLHAKRQVLEERNAALRHSLETQQRLTDDLVRRKEAEEEAYRAKAAAEAASEAKSFFLATMSHELRTPLNAILGYAQLLFLEGKVRGDQTNLEELGRIMAAGKHLLSLIGNILDFSKIEQGKLDLGIDAVQVAVLADDVVSIIAPLARENGNRVDLACAPEVGEIRSDAGKLRQILFNLLSNASKFTREGSIELRIEMDRVRDEERVSFRVSDTGIGIAAEDLEKIFLPFGQADSGTDRRFDGTGLGLVVSRQLCQILGGAIDVVSTLGKGSVFSFWLPVLGPESHREPGQESALLRFSDEGTRTEPRKHRVGRVETQVDLGESLAVEP